jgi:hypothetical protein
MFMFKKIILMSFLSIWLTASAMAGGHSEKFTISGTCTAKQFQIRMMGEMPLQFVGEMNCVEYAEMGGKQMDLNSSCTYAGVVIPGQKPMNNFTNTCHAFDADGDSIFMRFTGKDPLGAPSGTGQIVMLAGTGKFKGISGKANGNWQQSVNNVVDPMRWAATYQAVGSVKMN